MNNIIPKDDFTKKNYNVSNIMKLIFLTVFKCVKP